MEPNSEYCQIRLRVQTTRVLSCVRGIHTYQIGLIWCVCCCFVAAAAAAAAVYLGCLTVAITLFYLFVCFFVFERVADA